MAAKAGYAIAQTELGELYEREPAVQNLEEALHWYRKAAETYGPAMAELAHLYATGAGVPQDFDEAAKWYRQAVERDGYSGQYELGLLYEQRLEVAQDRDKAMEFYYGAATRDNADAQGRLFALYEADFALPSNPEKVIVWYETAAEEGNARAQVGLGLRYQFGKGVATNAYVARALYLIAHQSWGGQSENPTFLGTQGHRPFRWFRSTGAGEGNDDTGELSEGDRVVRRSPSAGGDIPLAFQQVIRRPPRKKTPVWYTPALERWLRVAYLNIDRRVVGFEVLERPLWRGSQGPLRGQLRSRTLVEARFRRQE